MTWLGHPALRIIVLLGLAALVIVRHLIARGRPLPLERWRRPTAAVVGVLVLLTVVDCAPWSSRFVNPHDLFHQYFGAKYHLEIDRFGLYPCTLHALDELSPRHHASVREVRDLRTYGMQRKASVLATTPACRSRFAPERWQRFKADLAQFDRLYRPGWGALLTDKGHNGTPVWNLGGYLVARAVPLRSHAQANLLGLIDWLLIAAAFLLVFRAAGGWVALIGLLYLVGCSELTSRFISGSLLRLDWLALLLAAVACGWTGRFRLAGALVGVATLLRIFPVLFLLGPALVAIRHLWAHRRIAVEDRRLFGAFAATCVALLAVSVGVHGGLSGWRDWRAKMSVHNGYIAGFRVGLQQTLVADVTAPAADRQGRGGQVDPTALQRLRREAHDRRWPLRLGIGIIILGLLGYGLWSRDRMTAAALSFPAIFVLATPTFYYYCLLAVVVVVLARAPRSRLSTGVILGLAALQVVLHVEATVGLRRSALSFTQSFLLLAVSLLTALAVARQTRPRTEGGPRSQYPTFDP
jgi:hypothetical protein